MPLFAHLPLDCVCQEFHKLKLLSNFQRLECYLCHAEKKCTGDGHYLLIMANAYLQRVKLTDLRNS